MVKNIFLVLFLVSFIVFSSVSAYAADCSNGGRYEDNADGTVTDCRTGMIWLKNANCTETSGGIDKSGVLNWHDAMKWAAGLGQGICQLTDSSYAGDWRLPTKTELMAMIAYAKSRYNNPTLTNGTGTAKWAEGDVFTDVQSDVYWSATTHADVPSFAWYVTMDYGYVNFNYKGNGSYVWPVRGGQSGTFGSLTIE